MNPPKWRIWRDIIPSHNITVIDRRLSNRHHSKHPRKKTIQRTHVHPIIIPKLNIYPLTNNKAHILIEDLPQPKTHPNTIYNTPQSLTWYLWTILGTSTKPHVRPSGLGPGPRWQIRLKFAVPITRQRTPGIQGTPPIPHREYPSYDPGLISQTSC